MKKFLAILAAIFYIPMLPLNITAKIMTFVSQGLHMLLNALQCLIGSIPTKIHRRLLPLHKPLLTFMLLLPVTVINAVALVSNISLQVVIAAIELPTTLLKLLTSTCKATEDAAKAISKQLSTAHTESKLPLLSFFAENFHLALKQIWKDNIGSYGSLYSAISTIGMMIKSYFYTTKQHIIIILGICPESVLTEMQEHLLYTASLTLYNNTMVYGKPPIPPPNFFDEPEATESEDTTKSTMSTPLNKIRQKLRSVHAAIRKTANILAIGTAVGPLMATTDANTLEGAGHECYYLHFLNNTTPTEEGEEKETIPDYRRHIRDGIKYAREQNHDNDNYTENSDKPESAIDTTEYMEYKESQTNNFKRR